MANPVYDGVKATAIIAAGGTTSNSFNVPQGAQSMTIMVAALGGTATYAIQGSIMPLGTTFVTATAWAEGGTPDALDGLGAAGAASVFTIGNYYFPGGTCRILLSEAAAAEITFYILFRI